MESASTPRSDAALARWAAEDPAGAFVEIVARFETVVYTLALRLCNQPADAEDLAAEAFARAWRALSRQPAGQTAELRLRAWLVTIVLNTWRNQLRERARRPRVTASLDGAEPPGRGADPADLVAGADARLVAALAGLPEAQRLAVLARHVVDLPYTDVAGLLGCPVGTAKSHVSRGLAALRTALAPDPTEGGPR